MTDIVNWIRPLMDTKMNINVALRKLEIIDTLQFQPFSYLVINNTIENEIMWNGYNNSNFNLFYYFQREYPHEMNKKIQHLIKVNECLVKGMYYTDWDKHLFEHIDNMLKYFVAKHRLPTTFLKSIDERIDKILIEYKRVMQVIKDASSFYPTVQNLVGKMVELTKYNEDLYKAACDSRKSKAEKIEKFRHSIEQFPKQFQETVLGKFGPWDNKIKKIEQILVNINHWKLEIHQEFSKYFPSK